MDLSEKIESQFPLFDKKVLHMMNKMGYQSGIGLGKNEQGITQVITIEPHFQRTGLGLESKNVEFCNETWDFTLDNTSVVEQIDWLNNNQNIEIDLETIATWAKEGKMKVNFQEECHFCDEEVLQNVTRAKNIFEELDPKSLYQARARANPFETLRSAIFMNRASLKMANIDSATGFMFTDINKGPLGPCYFADVCAGPGGFSEYVLWRKQWLFKGFGFTLKGHNDFKLNESNCACAATFQPLYGKHGDGDVCRPENITDFKAKVLFESEGKGVHFMMSDGGFSVEGNETYQEILSKNIYICQCLTALEILRQHGHFVTKLFDVFTDFSVGLLYLVYSCFQKMTIFKPNSSRPANSERYAIFCNYKGRDSVENVKSYLEKLVLRMWELRNDENVDIIEVVPLSVLKEDQEFYSYICSSNNRLAKRQTINLHKLATFCRNPTLIDCQQEELRRNCLRHWGIPEVQKVPAVPKYTIEDLHLETIHNTELLLIQPCLIHSIEDLDRTCKNLKDWHYVFMYGKNNRNTCNVYAGVGSSKTYRLQSDRWVKVKNLRLSKGTVLYGEIVSEKFVGASSSEVYKKFSLHVIDALRLGDLNLDHMNFEERNRYINVYCKTVNNEFRPNSLRVRPKIVNKLDCLSKEILSEDFQHYLPVLGYQVCKEFCEVNSILLLKSDKDQCFHSTYFLRMQVSLSQDLTEKRLSAESFIDFVAKKKL